MASRALKTNQFEQEVLQHLPSMLSVASRLMKNGPEAEELLVQDAVLKAIRARGQFETGTNLRAWLLKILTNTFINRYRRGGLERSVLDGPDANPLADGWVSSSTMEALRDPESQALRPILEAEIGKALEELPTEFRLAVVLSDVEDLSLQRDLRHHGLPDRHGDVAAASRPSHVEVAALRARARARHRGPRGHGGRAAASRGRGRNGNLSS
ncbi:MAG: sigma-70 family RNA polymerase sigma factor [Polyangiaceae bacterium]